MRLEYLTDFIMRFLSQIGALFMSFWGWILLIVGQIFVIDGFLPGMIVLGVAFLVDYATGMGAYWKEWKTEKATGDIHAAPYFLQSHKLRKSILKLTTYFLFIGMAWVMWLLFFDGTLHLPLSHKEVNIILISFGLCISVEFWSILENCKRMGYDILGGISKAFKGFWRSYREIKDGE